MNETTPTKADLLKRLRRIEGQVRGVAKMVEEDRTCADVVQQLAAIRAAVHQVSVMMVRDYASECLRPTKDGKTSEDRLNDLLNVLTKTAS